MNYEILETILVWICAITGCITILVVIILHVLGFILKKLNDRIESMDALTGNKDK